jgi:hypothetical protein
MYQIDSKSPDAEIAASRLGSTVRTEMKTCGTYRRDRRLCRTVRVAVVVV